MAAELELGPLRFGVVGAGRLGRVLARALGARGLELVGVSCATESGRTRATHALEVPAFSDPQQVLTGVDLVLVCVPDDHVVSVAAHLAEAVPAESAEVPRVVHTSGVVPLAALDPLAARGCPALTLHPLQTITERSVPADLVGVPAAITAADQATTTFGHALAHALGMVPFDLEEQARPLYHAAATMAANFTVTVQAAAHQLAARAGLHESITAHAFTRLAHAALQRVEREGPAAALTGPIVRGDTGTVESHLRTLEEHAPAVAELYRPLAHATVRLAMESGRLDTATAARMDDAVARAVDPEHGP